MKNKLLFLGTGSSSGVPVISCECKVCQSDSPYNKRFRPSILLKVGSKNILVDPGPDFRYQALKHKIKHLTAVIITHVHYDHIGGLDDLRIFYFIDKKPIHCLLSEASLDEIRLRYFYQFIEPKESNSKTVRFNYQSLQSSRGELDFHGINLRYLTYYQGDMPVMGLRIGKIAYISDIKRYDKTVFEDLRGVETLIVSGLRHTNSPMHFCIQEALDFANVIGPKRVFINHIGHELDHEITNSSLPEGVQLSYDGLELEF
ncbi:MAG: Phosphoribosyl 1,2-cyclic phosphate phosphodiesterase [Chlamydiae bacterium]|nr:Phosphoribosyl 1,2-cyclic phosphate phosphodiesterase [Chlamydiota bacterium]